MPLPYARTFSSPPPLTCVNMYVVAAVGGRARESDSKVASSTSSTANCHQLPPDKAPGCYSVNDLVDLGRLAVGPNPSLRQGRQGRRIRDQQQAAAAIRYAVEASAQTHIPYLDACMGCLASGCLCSLLCHPCYSPQPHHHPSPRPIAHPTQTPSSPQDYRFTPVKLPLIT